MYMYNLSLRITYLLLLIKLQYGYDTHLEQAAVA